MNSKVKYSKELLEKLVVDSLSVADVIRKLGLQQSGGNHSHITRRLKKYEIDTSHFLGSRTNSGPRHVGGPDKLLPLQILVDNRLGGRRESTSRLRGALIESGVPHKCEICGLGPEWQGKYLQLQIDHRDGNGTNNVPENLRFLCLHCHSQTDNFCSKNIKK